MTDVAIGSQTLLALGRELEPGVPTGALNFYKAVLPLAPFMVRSEQPGPENNPSGFMEPGMPAAVTGPWDGGVRCSASTVLELLEAAGFEAAKSTLATGIYQYLFTPRRTFRQTLWGNWSTPPVEHGYFHGLMLGGLNLAIQNNQMIVARFPGQIAHGTRLSQAEADGDNTGTYALGPWIRGPIATPANGRTVYVQVASVSPLTFKVEQTDGVPTFPGSAVTALITSLRGAWMNLQGATGLDIGFWAENKDPLELIWPGAAADHADLDVGDIFSFSLDWDDLTPTYLTGQRFTSAHAILRKREVGGSTWTEDTFQTAQINAQWPAVPEVGNGTRYPYRINREGLLNCGGQLVGRFDSLADVERVEAHKRMELQVELQGQQLSATYRESILAEYPYASIRSITRPIANANAIQQTATIAGEHSPDGDPPVTYRVITARDWTPSAGF